MLSYARVMFSSYSNYRRPRLLMEKTSRLVGQPRCVYAITQLSTVCKKKVHFNECHAVYQMSMSPRPPTPYPLPSPTRIRVRERVHNGSFRAVLPDGSVQLTEGWQRLSRSSTAFAKNVGHRRQLIRGLCA